MKRKTNRRQPAGGLAKPPLTVLLLEELCQAQSLLLERALKKCARLERALARAKGSPALRR